MSSRRLLSNSSRKRTTGTPSTAAGPSRSSGNNSNRTPELPPYEPPSCPLDGPARRALAELSTNHDTRKYGEQLTGALRHLSDSVRDLNDTYAERKKKLRGLQETRRRAAAEAEAEAESGDRPPQQQQQPKKTAREQAEEDAVLKLREHVPGLTAQCEAGVRGVIDWRVELEDGREALKDTAKAAEAESARAEARERQRRERERERNLEGDGEEEDQVGVDPDVDMQDESAAAIEATITGPLRLLNEAKRKAADEWSSKDMHTRYGLSNDYIEFKRLWHDAVYRGEKPLPDASRWFAHIESQAARDDEEATGEDGEEEDDVVIANENVSLLCPLSMQVMKDPYTSRLCKHTFDKANIEEYIASQSRARRSGNSSEPVICPQTGCSQEISKKVLYADAVMLRRIQRAERENTMGDADEDDDTADEDGDVSMRITDQRKIKTERGARGGRRVVEDVEDDEEEEDEDEYEGEESGMAV